MTIQCPGILLPTAYSAAFDKDPHRPTSQPAMPLHRLYQSMPALQPTSASSVVVSSSVPSPTHLSTAAPLFPPLPLSLLPPSFPPLTLSYPQPLCQLLQPRCRLQPLSAAAQHGWLRTLGRLLQKWPSATGVPADTISQPGCFGLCVGCICGFAAATDAAQVMLPAPVAVSCRAVAAAPWHQQPQCILLAMSLRPPPEPQHHSRSLFACSR